ncbi:MAG: glycoside hydrolase family 26 protein, partial [Endomicrobium sp.]|nr:glycoside hydrolase family 26 protein [Endomicrobium sp.]
GKLDANIIKFAKWIKKTKVPVFLRIGYEFDYPPNEYEPQLYVKAYRRIADMLDLSGVDNAAYVWHSYASLNPRGIEAWYPGDEYVDWCAISYFAAPQWIPMLKFSQKRNKPLMIAECSPVLGNDLKESGKMYWYKKLFNFITTHNVKALCYINANWDKQPMFENYNWGNCRIDVSGEIKDFFLKTLSDKRFVFSQTN